MGETALNIFFAFISIVLLLFIAGIILFIFQYRKRRVEQEQEKLKTAELHQLDLMYTQVKSQQEAMQYIGEEIHDNVGQKLTLASLYAKRLSCGGPASEMIEQSGVIGRIIDESLAELRQLSKTLSNPQLTSADIIALLKEEARQINAIAGCRLEITSNETVIPVTLSKKNILFRLLQEFIQNSLKHSGCRLISIRFEKQGDALFINASDNGKGFDIHLSYGGIGLQHMKKRAAQLQSNYTIASEPGKGTSLSLHLHDIVTAS